MARGERDSAQEDVPRGGGQTTRDYITEVKEREIPREELNEEGDQTLSTLHAWSTIAVEEASGKYSRGTITEEEARQAATAALNSTRSAAVSRSRLDGCVDSGREHLQHPNLQGRGMRPSPKTQGRYFGDDLRQKRGV